MTHVTTVAPPSRAALTDRWGRVADDLRISLIDKCNLRCTYCMPEHGLPWLPSSSLLTTEEAVRLADIGVRVFGVRDIRFTGGEPLVRRDLEDIVRGVRSLHPDVPVSLTTNAVGLDRRVAGLVDAGLTRVNVSLDTVRRETFREITRRDRLDAVLRGLAAARDAGLHPVKVNAVMMRGVNDDQADELLAWCLDEGYQLRFIEQMPLDADRSWSRTHLVDAAEIRDRLTRRFHLSPHPVPRGSAPAELSDVRHRDDPDGPVLGQVGLIAPVTESFCAACSRTRITADGKVRSCLFSQEETDLLGLLRSGADDAAVAARWQEAMALKPRAYGSDTVMVSDPSYVQPDRTMSAIVG